MAPNASRGVKRNSTYTRTQHQGGEQRPGPFDEQLLTHLRPDHLGALQLYTRIDFVEHLQDARAELIAFRVRIRRQAHQDISRAAEGLHLRSRDACPRQGTAQRIDIRGLRETGLDDHAAREIHAQVEPADAGERQ